MEQQPDERYAEPISTDAEELGTAPAVPALPEPLPSETPRTRARFRMGFFQKISMHLILSIVAGGFILATVVTIQFRRFMYEQEYRSASAVYAAVAHYYVAAHQRVGEEREPARDLEEWFAKGWLKTVTAGTAARPKSVQRYIRLALYAPDGTLIHEHPDGAAQELTPAGGAGARLQTLTPQYDPGRSTITVRGPVGMKDEVLAYLHMALPTDIRAKLYALYGQVALATVLIVILAIVLSLIFTRRHLEPVKLLTQAASEVRGGNLEQRVPVRHEDEIGELATTFNEMVDSLSTRITLMHRLQEGIVKIGRELESERLHHTLVQTFASLASSPSCRLYLYHPQKDRLSLRLTSAETGLPPPVEDVLAQHAFQERWATYLKANGQLSEEAAVAVELAIPLLSGHHRIGVIRMGRPERDQPYSVETLAILHTLAQFASVAIENANLYGELEEKQRIEQEMLWARNIQQSMLPRNRPLLPGYQIYGKSIPAHEVGGDYFDYVQSKDSVLHIIIGDVSGKGVPAALIMSILRSLIHTYLEFESSPRDMLSMVNRSLSPDLGPDMFVTLSSIRLDATRNLARLARAGHEPLMVLRASGEVEHIAPRGTALGLLETERFRGVLEEMTLPLNPHETLLLYTDGVTEAQNNEHQDFGRARLEALLKAHAHLPPEQLLDAVVQAVHAYKGEVPQLDDITLVVVRRDGA